MRQQRWRHAERTLRFIALHNHYNNIRLRVVVQGREGSRLKVQEGTRLLLGLVRIEALRRRHE